MMLDECMVSWPRIFMTRSIPRGKGEMLLDGVKNGI